MTNVVGAPNEPESSTALVPILRVERFTKHFAEVKLAFLEQEPFASGWSSMIQGKHVVALPLLVAQGMHAGRDIPPLFGLRQGETGPVDCEGRRVALATGLGAEPELEEIILDLVRGSP